MSICTQIDDWMVDYIENHPRWEVMFNNNLKVYQDDLRPTPSNSWLKLKDYCEQNSLYIVTMRIGFRDNVHTIESNMDGYYFINAARSYYGSIKSLKIFVVGFVYGNIVYTSSWQVPEMIKLDSDQRNIEGCREYLIMKNCTNLSMVQPS